MWPTSITVGDLLLCYWILIARVFLMLLVMS
jgi:hypothetical protein